MIDPAVLWLEQDPRSPYRLERCDGLRGTQPVDGLVYTFPIRANFFEITHHVRPMFSVKPTQAMCEGAQCCECETYPGINTP